MSEMTWLRADFARWGNDPGFRAASTRATAAWVRLVFASAANVEHPGRLVRQGRPLSLALIAGLVGMALAETEEAIGELLELGLVERDDAGALVFGWVVEEKKYFDDSVQQKVEAGRKGGLERNKRHPQTPKAKQTPSGARGVLEQTPSRPLAEGKRTPTTYIQTDIQTDIQTQQQHAPGGDAAGDAAAAEAAHGDEAKADEEHDDKLLALSGMGITGEKAAELLAMPWVTTETIRTVKSGMRPGERTGLAITRLENDERGKWEDRQRLESSKAAAESAKTLEQQQQRERLAREARAHHADDEALLSETGEAELVASMARVPDLRQRAAIRTGLRDERGLPIESVLRHAVAAEVRAGRAAKAAMAKVRPVLVPAAG